MMINRTDCAAHAISGADLRVISDKRLAVKVELKARRNWPCKCRNTEQRDRRPNCCCAEKVLSAGEPVDQEKGSAEPAGTNAINDAALSAALKEFIGTLIERLDPHYAEVVWRAEILDQPNLMITQEMDLSERTVAERLRTGRRNLLQLILLTLEQTTEDQTNRPIEDR